MEKSNGTEPTKEAAKEKCGLIMPISASGSYTAAHWSEVREIISEVVHECKMSAVMVSDDDNSGVIHNRIVTNILENPLVICDTSSRNPNVMFELGLRLAFDKPAILIKDSETDFSFDTSLIEHLVYPRTLHYPSMVTFKEKLKARILATSEAAKKDPEYSTFLQHIVKIRPKRSHVKEMGSEEFILRELSDIKRKIHQIAVSGATSPSDNSRSIPTKLTPGAVFRYVRAYAELHKLTPKDMVSQHGELVNLIAADIIRKNPTVALILTDISDALHALATGALIENSLEQPKNPPMA